MTSLTVIVLPLRRAVLLARRHDASCRHVPRRRHAEVRLQQRVPIERAHVAIERRWRHFRVNLVEATSTCTRHVNEYRFTGRDFCFRGSRFLKEYILFSLG